MAGNWKPIDLEEEVGKTYFCLTILEAWRETELAKHGHRRVERRFVKVKAKCVCGRVGKYRLAILRNRKQKSCGCLSYAKQNQPWVQEKEATHEKWRIKQKLEKQRQEAQEKKKK